MDIKEYCNVLYDDIALLANTNITTSEEEFIKYVTELLIDAEEFDDFTECYYEGISRRPGKPFMKIDGYARDEADGSCCIFISEFNGPYVEDPVVRADDINNAFKKMRYFIEESCKNELYLDLEESTECYEFAKELYYDLKDITKFRFYYITDAQSKQRKKKLENTTVEGILTELNVWDIERIYDLVNSTMQKESVEINMSDYDVKGIPCVKAVEYKDVVADIETSNVNDDDNKNLITYSSFLAVVPGKILNELYLEYGSRLLEGNVRSFLSVKGKVNKAIQNTIKNYPEMFFAYNNGIAATATEIDTEMTAQGLVITRIKDLQIVNGGQTTASITNTLLHLRKDENVDIDSLFVPMKISELEHEMSEKIIPKISEYSNSQNKVDASDFFSNHPFHIRMEEHSRKTPAPAVGGNQFQQYWFYERTRGQYNQGKMKFKAKSKELKQYETRYPSNQVIKMVELAKYMELYYCEPHVVSKGKQVIVKEFANRVKAKWDKNNSEFNASYFKRVVAIAILFKRTDDIVKQSDWYKLKHSYKANVVAYTLSVLFNYIQVNLKGYDIDFMRIWNKQEIYPELVSQLQVLCTEVYEFITSDDRPQENVTQWCKQLACWERAKKVKWNIQNTFLKTLISNEEKNEEEHSDRDKQKINSEVECLSQVVSAGSAYWKQVYEWGFKRALISEMELKAISILCNMEITGKTPSPKNAKMAIKARERLISEGMPIKFTKE